MGGKMSLTDRMYTCTAQHMARHEKCPKFYLSRVVHFQIWSESEWIMSISKLQQNSLILVLYNVYNNCIFTSCLLNNHKKIIKNPAYGRHQLHRPFFFYPLPLPSAVAATVTVAAAVAVAAAKGSFRPKKKEKKASWSPGSLPCWPWRRAE